MGATENRNYLWGKGRAQSSKRMFEGRNGCTLPAMHDLVTGADWHRVGPRHCDKSPLPAGLYVLDWVSRKGWHCVAGCEASTLMSRSEKSHAGRCRQDRRRLKDPEN